MDKASPGRMVVSAAQRESLATTRCSTKDKREVATKPFSHRRPLKNVFNDSLGSHVPIASGLHVSNFPNRIARAIVLA